MNKEFFYEMIATESVSGCEIELQKKIAAYMRQQGVTVQTDYSGNVISSINPDSPFKVLLCGHVDEIGFRVTHITDDGYLKVNRAGGIYLPLVQGKRVTVVGREKIVGVMGTVLGKDGVRTDIEFTDLYVDCGFANREEAMKLVAPGDSVTYTYTVDELHNDCIAGRGLDNRMGAYAVTHALLRAREKGAKVGVYAATTTGEETTMRGAFYAAGTVRPTIAIAVDVIHSTDFSTSNPARFGQIKINGGPVICKSSFSNPVINRALEKAAEKLGIAVQYEICGGVTGTDADKVNQTDAGVPSTVVSIPLRYMHSPSEVGSLRDLDQTVEVLAEFLAALDESFTPDPFAE
jgi:endoglucanase